MKPQTVEFPEIEKQIVHAVQKSLPCLSDGLKTSQYSVLFKPTRLFFLQ
ncbi:MAG: hypothetical protein MR739_04875 [Spirochaetia bacterium]|nr:hypothetical protein [Spirochaetia bacterium]MDD7610169.1 hypothetical protein [Spirochaetales bacterium]MDY5914462.1 hypothetical protein [Treponema sp.]